MKKTPTFIILCLLCIVLNAQNDNILVEYKATKGRIVNNETLIAYGGAALYLTDSLLIERDNMPITNEDEYNNHITISQKRIQLDATAYYLKPGDNTIFFTQQHMDAPGMVKDVLPHYQWDLSHNETKTIGDFVCRKATTEFRGSQIVAWYTETINIPFGPWKFKDLPGLILELYNINSPTTHSWTAVKIKYPYKNTVDYNFDSDTPLIDYQTVVFEREKKIKEQIRRMQSRVPAGVMATETKINRTGIEKTYEWENR